jgi:nucleotide-binding universal stress UspA family protein
MLKTILVALDREITTHPAPFSDQVLQTLLQFQLMPTTQVILTHVVPATQSEMDIVSDRPQVETENHAYSQSQAQLQAYQATLSCPSQLEIVTGDPAEEIIRLAKIHKADLILIGSRGLTGMQRILLGSVSSQVVADAPCSVLVVKPQ